MSLLYLILVYFLAQFANGEPCPMNYSQVRKIQYASSCMNSTFLYIFNLQRCFVPCLLSLVNMTSDFSSILYSLPILSTTMRVKHLCAHHMDCTMTTSQQQRVPQRFFYLLVVISAAQMSLRLSLIPGHIYFQIAVRYPFSPRQYSHYNIGSMGFVVHHTQRTPNWRKTECTPLASLFCVWKGTMTGTVNFLTFGQYCKFNLSDTHTP